MRSIIVWSTIVGTLVLASRSALATEEPTGVEVGLRTGYALPMGDAMGQTPGVKSDTTMSDVISGGIPIWVDAGYRLTPNVYIGGFFQYGILFINTDHETYCKASGISCSANDIMFGVNAHYHFMPNATFDPWAGSELDTKSSVSRCPATERQLARRRSTDSSSSTCSSVVTISQRHSLALARL